MNPEKISPFWWIGNRRYFLYFLRELSGPVIAVYAVLFLFLRQYQTFFGIASVIVFAFACLHSITWFFVFGKLIGRNKWHIFGIAVLCVIIWIFASWFILKYFYIPPRVIYD